MSRWTEAEDALLREACAASTAPDWRAVARLLSPHTDQGVRVRASKLGLRQWSRQARAARPAPEPQPESRPIKRRCACGTIFDGRTDGHPSCPAHRVGSGSVSRPLAPLAPP